MAEPTELTSVTEHTVVPAEVSGRDCLVFLVIRVLLSLFVNAQIRMANLKWALHPTGDSGAARRQSMEPRPLNNNKSK